MTTEQQELEWLSSEIGRQRAEIERLSKELDRRDGIERYNLRIIKGLQKQIKAMKRLLLVYLASD